MTGPLVLKLGGELVETPDQRSRIAMCVASLTLRQPLVVVHGGGRAIDAELARRGIAPKKVDGLRVTDAATLDVVVAVLAGSANTALVAALAAAGVNAVGLTGADGLLGQAKRSNAHRTAAGHVVDLGLVGDPVRADPGLLKLLSDRGYVPVVASLGVDREPPHEVLNVNADVMACRIAAALGARLVIAGATPGVLDTDGATIPTLEAADIRALVADGTATAGMVAKLTSCLGALEDGVSEIRIVDGRGLDATLGPDDAPGTLLMGPAALEPAHSAGRDSARRQPEGRA